MNIVKCEARFLRAAQVFVAFAGALGQKLRGECCAWTLNHVAAFYGDVWEGPLSEAANQFPSATVRACRVIEP